MDLITYTNKEAVAYTNPNLRKATVTVLKLGEAIKRNLFAVAAVIKNVNDTACYKDDGFESVHQWTAQAFGFAKTASYNLLKIGAEYTQAIEKGGKITGYVSNLLPADSQRNFTTTQIEKMLPVGHDKAAELVEAGVLQPEMTVKEIAKAIKDATKPTEPEAEEQDEGAFSDEEPTDIETRIVTDEYGVRYEVPVEILVKWKL